MCHVNSDIDSKYVLKRRAPPPPKFYTKSAQELNFVNDIATNVVHIRHTNIENRRNRTPSNQCLVSVIEKLIEKEEQYVLKLKLFLRKLGVVSTSVCNKLPLMKHIMDFHTKTLFINLLEIKNPADIPNVFLKHQQKLELYVYFVEGRNDFSYLVMDICESIIDCFKARLLEYNFTLSQIKNIYINDLKVKSTCEASENVIKNVYQKINCALAQREDQEELRSDKSGSSKE